VLVEPIKPTMKAPGPKCLELQHAEPLSIYPFKFNLRRYTKVCPGFDAEIGKQAERILIAPRNIDYVTNVLATKAGAGSHGTVHPCSSSYHVVNHIVNPRLMSCLSSEDLASVIYPILHVILIAPSYHPHTLLIAHHIPLIPPSYPQHTPLIPPSFPAHSPLIPPSDSPLTPLRPCTKVEPGIPGEKPVRVELSDFKTREVVDVMEVDAVLVATGRSPFTQVGAAAMQHAASIITPPVQSGAELVIIRLFSRGSILVPSSNYSK